MQIQIKTCEAWLGFSRGKELESLQTMKEAADMEDKTDKHGVTPGEVLPARELYGDMLFVMNRFEESLEAYELGLKSRPNRFNSIYAAAISARNLGDGTKAKYYFQQLLVLTEESNSDRPEISEALTFVNKLG